MRSILAIIVGFLTMNFIVILFTTIAVAILHLKSTHPTSGYLVFNILYSFLAATAAGYVAALIAGRKPLQHALVLAAIMLAFGIFSYRHYTGLQPHWYQLIMIAVPPLCVLAGASIEARSARSLTS